MAILGSANGVFDLRQSDLFPGSFFTREDTAEILGVNKTSLMDIPAKNIDGIDVIDEREIQKAWYSGAITGAPPTKIGRATRSFDEMVLAKLIEIEVPGINIEQQLPWGRKTIDFLLTYPDGKKIALEFHGPSHFAPGRYQQVIEDPRIRQKEVAEYFQCESVIWPYWIQRCIANVKCLRDSQTKGYGLLWSATTMFSDFVFENSDEIIEGLSNRFNIRDQDGYGYIYGPNTRGRNNPEHPILKRIRNGKTGKERLIPKGAQSINEWLPTEFH